MNKFLSDLAAEIEPYVPGEQPKDRQYVKLNTNENPYPPSPNVIKAAAAAANDELRLYPDPGSTGLIAAASRSYDIPEKMIFTGNGSDEVLAFAFAAFYSGGKIIYPEVTYSFYPVYCGLFNVSNTELPMLEGMSMDTESMTGCGCGVVFPNPNAPTGELLDLQTIEMIVASNPDDVVLVDEAYIDFGGKSCVSLVKEYENLLVVQTFSKSRSLAGMRIGLAFGSPLLIDGLNRIKNSFNSYPLDRVAQAAGAAALDDSAYYEEIQGRIIKTRAEAVQTLGEMGFDILESSANFIFVSHKKKKAADIYNELKAENVLVRYFGKPGIDNFVRITIGTDEQMKILYSNLEKILPG